LYQTVNGCYAHSALPALAFRLATVSAKMQWRGAFSPFSSDSTDNCGLTLNIWQRVVNTFAASYLNTQGLNNSCLKSRQHRP